MKTNRQHYDQMVKKASPNSKLGLNCFKAFIVGGLICVLGQFLYGLFESWGATNDQAATYVAITLIFSAVLLTGIGKFDDLVNFAGAGAAVPITGFANAMASPAIEFKKEGYIFGVGAKMFLIAGPVIVYGTLASMLVGIVYFFIQR
ncbi:MAG: stage V sporulation protein AC [Clostridiales bacterium]|jgi:stage V sporulation protein AC|nr:stage V sporulation protein AC [Clostridiales bacterium]